MAKFEHINKGFAKVLGVILRPIDAEDEEESAKLVSIELMTDTGIWYVVKESNIISYSRDQATSFGKDDLLNNLGEVVEKLDWY